MYVSYEKYKTKSREQLLWVLGAKIHEPSTAYRIRAVGKASGLPQYIIDKSRSFHGGWSMWEWQDRVIRHLSFLRKKGLVKTQINERGRSVYSLTDAGKREAFLIVL